jgi:hypothetical protein
VDDIGQQGVHGRKLESREEEIEFNGGGVKVDLLFGI